MDVAVVGDRAFVIGGGKLHVLDIVTPDQPKVLGSLDGLGNTRQIAVSNGVAFVSARESGLFVVDVRDTQPKLITRYDSIEFATGVAVAGHVLFIAQRQYGVELVDVTDVRHPRHLSTVRTGEAQSIAYHDGMLYTGVWGSSEVVTVDVRDPLHPRLVSKAPLDGYGDGLAVHGGLLFAATGHHSRQPHRNPEDAGYGMGHGLELFSLADPAQPKFLGRVKFPRFYAVGLDMWGVKVKGKTAFVSDTHNGMFIVDVSEPAAPRIVSRTELPTPPGKPHADCVGGFGLVKDYIYAAGATTALHIIEAIGVARPVTNELGVLPAIPAAEPTSNPNIFRPGGQVHAVAVRGDLAVAACGSAGIHVVRTGKALSPLSATPTEGFASDVAIVGDSVFVAEGEAGMAIYDLDKDGRLTKRGRYPAKALPVRHLALPAPGRFALIEVGGSTLQILDVADRSRPRLALEDKRFGLLYGNQLCDQLVDGRYAAAFWHASGVHWYDLGGTEPVFAGQHPAGRFDMLNGLSVFQGEVVTPRHGGLVFFAQNVTGDFDSLPVVRISGVRLSGRISVSGHRLALANRATGEVFIVDVTDRLKPKLIEKRSTDGNPGLISFTASGVLIPAGYNGLEFCPLAE
ncbi:MAG: hypothetical protein JSS27_03605 [Planctomycetes bacterium]|nr:hypothetical protein [Planctomycetota bacterium]